MRKKIEKIVEKYINGRNKLDKLYSRVNREAKGDGEKWYVLSSKYIGLEVEKKLIGSERHKELKYLKKELKNLKKEYVNEKIDIDYPGMGLDKVKIYINSKLMFIILLNLTFPLVDIFYKKNEANKNILNSMQEKLKKTSYIPITEAERKELKREKNWSKIFGGYLPGNDKDLYNFGIINKKENHEN